MVLIECLAAHKPFISTNVGEIKRMLTATDESIAGKVLELHDGAVSILELSAAIIELANDPADYEQCRKSAVECSKRFSIDLVARQYEEVYNACLSTKQPARNSATDNSH